MDKGTLAEDPRGLIFEAYRIEGITGPDCRTIFLDWALGLPPEIDARAAVQVVLAHYAPLHPDHPMTRVLREGMERKVSPRRRTGRE